MVEETSDCVETGWYRQGGGKWALGGLGDWSVGVREGVCFLQYAVLRDAADAWRWRIHS